MKLILCVPRMQIALASIQRKIKFNVAPCDFASTHFNLVPSFPGYEIAELLSFLFVCFLIFVFFWFKLKKKKQQQQQPHYKRITFHVHPVFHPITLCYIRSAVVWNSFPNRAGSRQIYHLMQRIIKHFSAIYLVFFVISLTITSQ